VAIDDSPVGHLEFALRHEGVNLEVIDAALPHLEAEALAQRFNAVPNGEAIRRACAIWEWLTGQSLPIEKTPGGGYVGMFPEDKYITAAGVREPKYRVRINPLGTSDFCPVVRKHLLPPTPTLEELFAEAQQTLSALADPALYERAVQYLYLSETRSSFAIEKELPSSDKQERFVQLLKRAGEQGQVDEEWLASLQNLIVRDAYSQEAAYRSKQNWLDDSLGRITFLPPPPEELPALMHGWEAFANSDRCSNILVRAACAAFGFVYLHPFMDGNGRLHRFLIHHVLAQSEQAPKGVVLPVSAVILRDIPAYAEVLNGFSRPVTALWSYRRGADVPLIDRHPSGRPYRFFDASREVAYLHEMLCNAVRKELPQELAWLTGYDRAFQELNERLNLPRSDLSALIRMVKGNGGKLSANKRKLYAHLPDEVIADIEQTVRNHFEDGLGNQVASPGA
jgi:hypothetical protein